ncbi:MAG: NUDIX hydrolase [SAR202 cluster bacterium]|nr:NUDIX hydrolase [SAR202 cluster bacterium]MQG78866.1 NUDIX hydrolase [SAR202 cluster bacterium]|tara:strand:+ start:12118 stop:12681 length:564 start_codon:yes stop_codon:yes gene_type:complete
MPEITPQDSSDSLSEPTIDTRRIYEGSIINVRVDTVRMPNGISARREVVEHSPAVCIVPVDENGNVILVRQYRKPAEEALLEVPAGGVEEGEVSEEAVLRELQEEIGYTAGKLVHLSSFWVAPGWATEFMHAYLATELSPSRLDADEDENIQVVRVPFDDAVAMFKTGEIQDGKTIASLLLAKPLLS